MWKLISHRSNNSGPHIPIDEPDLRRRESAWIRKIYLCLTIAGITGFGGLAIAAITLLHLIRPGGIAAQVGNALLVVAFIVLMAAAHCLDGLDNARHRIRVEAVRQKLYAGDMWKEEV
jgi:hypothetical protein